MSWQYVEQDNRNVFDVWLCYAAGFIGAYHLFCVDPTWKGEMCLIKRIPLKSVMECWISFVSNMCDNRGKRRAASVFEKLEMFDRRRGGTPAQSQEDGAELKSSKQRLGVSESSRPVI